MARSPTAWEVVSREHRQVTSGSPRIIDGLVRPLHNRDKLRGAVARDLWLAVGTDTDAISSALGRRRNGCRAVVHLATGARRWRCLT